MSAAEDDTELRDLLIQNLENSGVLNKLKAEMRAAVFLAMEDQDRLENKTPLVNENLRKCLDTKDGRLVASLIVDFLQVFNLDFSLAVFQPEINSLNGLDSRDLVSRELGLSESNLNQNSPLLLELVRRGRQQDKRSDAAEGHRGGNVPKELSQKQITHARKRFDLYDKDQSGSVRRDDLKNVFSDLFPTLNKNMLERFITDELRAADRLVDFQMFLEMYRRLFSQCRSVVVQDSDVSGPQHQFPEDKLTASPVSKIPRYKGQRSQTAVKDSAPVPSLGKDDLQQQTSNNRTSTSAVSKEHLDLDLEAEEDLDEGDSFFDDPLPKPQKTYGGQNCPVGKKDSAERTDVPEEKVDTPGTRGSPAGSASEAQRPGRGGSSASELSHSRNGASRDKGFRALSDRMGSLHLDDDVEYDDDFNSHRSDLSKSELSIGEEIEEVSIEGPDHSDKYDGSTQDLSISQLSQSHGADYMEDVA
ncbi:FGFR1 oncogene partner isoform X6 [Melanotaenia boesemani]|uniref:FGFR1 oncogene partner isoform X6 n=1 Tax=Melanotaenia boesemani TaxID=1250792 RepID=UPI001C04EDED|nr:FGFR1 oncogene partner isoform X6 [Melanotaenia boesemani]